QGHRKPAHRAAGLLASGLLGGGIRRSAQGPAPAALRGEAIACRLPRLRRDVIRRPVKRAAHGQWYALRGGGPARTRPAPTVRQAPAGAKLSESRPVREARSPLAGRSRREISGAAFARGRGGRSGAGATRLQGQPLAKSFWKQRKSSKLRAASPLQSASMAPAA